MTNLSGRSAIVTGGFSGMGFAIATALAQAGANVAVGSYIAPAGSDKSDAAYYPGADEIERGWGRIVNIGSTAASVGWKDNPAYCASKAGLLGLTRCVALEGAAHGVTCVMISPTWVETELMRRNVAQVVEREGKGRTPEEAMAEIAKGNPQQRLLQPQEIAALAVFLCSDLAKGITMENIQVTGGALW